MKYIMKQFMRPIDPSLKFERSSEDTITYEAWLPGRKYKTWITVYTNTGRAYFNLTINGKVEYFVGEIDWDVFTSRVVGEDEYIANEYVQTRKPKLGGKVYRKQIDNAITQMMKGKIQILSRNVNYRKIPT